MSIFVDYKVKVQNADIFSTIYSIDAIFIFKVSWE